MNSSWKRWDSHPVVPKAAALQTAPVTLPSTLPWGDRRDLHPLPRGSHPRASATSASITVRLERIERSSLAHQASALAIVRQAGLAAVDLWSGWQELHLRPRGPEPRVLLAELRPEKQHVASESNAAGPGLEPGLVPDGDVWRGQRSHAAVYCTRVTQRATARKNETTADKDATVRVIYH